MSHNNNTGWTPTQLAYWTLIVHIPSIVLTNSIILITLVLLRHNRTMDSYAIGLLAMADLMIGLVCVPFIMAAELRHDFLLKSSAHHLCRKVPTNFAFALSQSMLMLINIDRVLAINWPFWYLARATNIKIVLSGLALLLMDGVVYIILLGYVLSKSENENIDACCLAFYYGKFLISIGCTANVALQLTKSIKYIRGSVNKHQFRAMKTKSKITVALTTLYVILWLPKLIEHTIQGDVSEVTVTHAITDHILFLNSSVNVFVYSLTREAYKVACTFILTNPPCEWKHLPRIVATVSRYSTYSGYSSKSRQSSKTSVATPSRRITTPALHDVTN